MVLQGGTIEEAVAKDGERCNGGTSLLSQIRVNQTAMLGAGLLANRTQQHFACISKSGMEIVSERTASNRYSGAVAVPNTFTLVRIREAAMH